MGITSGKPTRRAALRSSVSRTGTSAAKGASKAAAKNAAKKSLKQKAWDAVKPTKIDIPLAIAGAGANALMRRNQDPPAPEEPPDDDADDEPTDDGPLDHEDRTSDGPLDLTQPQIPHGATPLVAHTELGDVNVNLGVDLDSLFETVLHCKCPC